MPEGNRVSLHSTRDPLAEAQLQLGVVDDPAPPVVVLVGAGLGFVTEAARRRWPAARIIVVEPVAQLADGARSRTPELYRSDKVDLVIGPDYPGAEELWRAFGMPTAGEDQAPAVITHPVLARALPEPMAHAVSLVQRAVRAAQMNARARRDNAGRYLLNTLRNLPCIVHGASPDRLRGKFDGVPAVVVAAGPSLDRNLPALRALSDRPLIVATDTAWRPLATAGVDPHVVVALDPTAANGQHLVRVPSRRETWVLAEGSVDPAALQPLSSRTATFKVGPHHPWPWLQRLGLDRPLVNVWGSVLTAAYDLALGFGCDPVILVGADLAFTDERPYCRGTTFEQEWASHTARGVNLHTVWRHTLESRQLLEVPSVHGEDVLTAPHLVEVRDWLLARASETSRRVVNATGGGILFGPGVDQVDLEAGLDVKGEGDLALRATIRESCRRRPDPSIVDSVVQGLGDIVREPPGETDDSATSPISDWLDFGSPMLTAAEIHAAAVAARDGLVNGASAPADPASPAPASHPPRFHEADRVALMRSVLTGERSVLDGCDRPKEARGRCVRRDAADEAVELIDSLLAIRRLTTGLGEAEVCDDNAHALPLSYRFRWTESAAALIAPLEELLIEVESALHGGATGFPHGHLDYWSGPVLPVLDEEDEQQLRPIDNEQAACLTLGAHRHALLRARATSTGSAAECERFVRAVARGVLDPALTVEPDAPFRLEFPGPSGHMTLPLRVDALMRAFTGALAISNDAPRDSTESTSVAWPELRVVSKGQAAPDPRIAFLASSIAFVEPEILTDLPLGWSLATLDGERAIFAPHLVSTSVLIGSDGRSESGSNWPVAITGEVGWGSEGGALAWNRVDKAILLRSQAEGDPIVERVPFEPAQVVLRADGSPIWCALAGGLWDWLPGRSGRLLVDTPSGCLRLDDSDLVVAPVVRDRSGRVTRRRLTHEFRCDTSGHTMRRTATGREGQCGSVARRGEWAVRTYPFSDLVRIERVGARPLNLACYAPFGVAWAGSSLLVTAGDGTVLLFRQFMDRVSALP